MTLYDELQKGLKAQTSELKSLQRQQRQDGFMRELIEFYQLTYPSHLIDDDMKTWMAEKLSTIEYCNREDGYYAPRIQKAQALAEGFAAAIRAHDESQNLLQENEPTPV